MGWRKGDGLKQAFILGQPFLLLNKATKEEPLGRRLAVFGPVAGS